MRNLPLCFKFFTWCGFWRPLDASPSVKILYNAYSASSFLIVFTFMIFEILDIVINIDNKDDFMNCSVLLPEMIAVSYKAINILVNRTKFLEVTDMLLENFCQSSDDMEDRIQEKFDRLDKENTQKYAAVVMSSTMCLILVAFFNSEGVLPFRIWLPYSISTLTLYWISFVYQITALLIATVMSIAYDTFIPGLMIQVCAQLDILKLRFSKFAETEFSEYPNDDCVAGEQLKNCIRHHHHIIKFAATLEKDFNFVIFLQCLVSLGTVCSSVFQLLTINVLSIRFVSMCLYLASMLFQLFIYCWYGNEVILKSTEMKDAIFQMNWTFLKNSTKKTLIIVMIRSQRAIQFTSGYIITLSLESYVAILKASYSVYNVLQ